MGGALFLVLARGGSKGIPGKNIVSVCGAPLIAWTLSAALSARHTARVVVSTDSEEVANVARRYGGEVPFMRPAEFASDTATSLDAALHCLRVLADYEHYAPDWLVLLQPTSPLRLAKDIDAAMDMAITNTSAKAVVSVSPVAGHPYWAKRVSEDGGLVDLLPGGYSGVRRQDLPAAFMPNGAVYAIRPETLFKQQSWYPSPTLACQMPTERSLDVDTPWDMRLAELILRDSGRAVPVPISL